jgi:DNA invertase Pin-like site-specific DNA recombinase
MFLRQIRRKKDGKTHVYWNIVENRRLDDGRVVQRQVLYLGEIGSSQAVQAVDTTTPAGRALFQMLGVFAEFERSIIVERVNAGIARARTQGTKSGKPIGRPPLASERDAAIRASLAAGVGIVKTARLHKTGVSVVQRIRSEIAAVAAE